MSDNQTYAADGTLDSITETDRGMEVLDLRPEADASAPTGSTFATVTDLVSRDTDDQKTTADNYQARTEQKALASVRSTVTKTPTSFNSRSANGSRGAVSISDPSLSGVGFGSRGQRVAGARNTSLRLTRNVFGLPLPDNLQETMGIAYNAMSMGPFAMLQQQLIQGLIQTGKGFMADDAGTAQQRFENAGRTMAAPFANALENYTGPGGTQAQENLLYALGNMVGIPTGKKVAFNNTLMLSFAGVEPRSFTFNWKLYPESPIQSARIQRFINTMKVKSHPKVIDELFNIVEFPGEVHFNFRGPNGLIIFPMHKAVITNIDVNYSSSGMPTFFKNGAPTSINLSISVQEVTSRTADDILRTTPVQRPTQLTPEGG